MNHVSFIEGLVNGWNEEERCGLCWKFVGAGRTDYLNFYEPTKDESCCVVVGLIGIYDFTEIDYNGISKCYSNIDLFVGIPSHLSLPFYNENGNCANNKWDNYINKINECFGCDFNYCSDSEDFELITFSKELKFNFQDLNMDGWLVKLKYKNNY